MSRKKEEKRTRRKLAALENAVSVFYFLAFILLYIRGGDLRSLLLAVAIPAVCSLSTLLLSRFFSADRLLISLINFLCALGVLMLYRLDPEMGMTQAMHYGVGVAFMIVCILAVKQIRKWPALILLMMMATVAMLAIPAAFGKEINGAKAWIPIGSYSLQPSEPGKVLLLLCVAFLLSRRQHVLAILFAGICLVLLMLQKDLGTALLYFFTVLLMLYISTGSLLLLCLGLAAGAAAAYLGYTMFAHVRVRVSMWQDPWQDPWGKGYQIVLGLIAMVNGGVWGMGLGNGNAAAIPAAQNDYIFAVIMNEFGLFFALLVVLIYLMIAVRGMMIARRSSSQMYALLAAGGTVMLAMQTFIIIGGVIKLIPLTGVTLPFISSGGSSMLAAMGIAGLIQGVGARNNDLLSEDEEIAGYGGTV